MERGKFAREFKLEAVRLGNRTSNAKQLGHSNSTTTLSITRNGFRAAIGGMLIHWRLRGSAQPGGKGALALTIGTKRDS